MTDLKLLAGIGGKIRELRLSRQMTQNELALQCSFDKASMSRIESGKTNITILTLKRIATALNVDIVEFFK
jgi:putative transcriptional regulator